jgi:DNA repair protein RadC
MSRSTTYTPRAYRAVRVTHLRAATLLNEDESAQVLAALSTNQQLLRDLMLSYDAAHSCAAGRHRHSTPPTIGSPQDVSDLLGEEMGGLVQEQLRVLLLDTKHKLMRWEVIYQGTVDTITVRPAELLRSAVLENAPAVLLVHNHPSGDPTPSPEDIRTTECTIAAGQLLSIDVLAHFVLGGEGRYVSIRERSVRWSERWAHAA